ncbi:UNVERIFIED_CONTAM: hypothetical protein K2H54_024648 [Gekko kuhli]
MAAPVEEWGPGQELWEALSEEERLDPEEGLSMGPQDARELSQQWEADPHFVAGRQEDEKLVRLYAQVAVSEGVVVDPRQSQQMPQAVRVNRVWCRMVNRSNRGAIWDNSNGKEV